MKVWHILKPNPTKGIERSQEASPSPLESSNPTKGIESHSTPKRLAKKPEEPYKGN